MMYSVPNLRVLHVSDHFAARGRAARLDVQRLADVALELSGVVRSLQGLRQLLIAPSDDLRVLVVSEGPRRRASIHGALHGHHDIVDASGYADALVLLATEIVDAVVTESKIGPIGSGGALLAEVRERWPLLRRVLLVPTFQRAHAALLETGLAHQVLPFPLDADALLASLRSDQAPLRAPEHNGPASSAGS